jgi:hypothetical protein
MAVTGYLTRDKGVVWRDIAGEVVIAEMDNSRVRVLNRTASQIWILADGTRRVGDIISELCNRFQVTPEQARVDAEDFCNQLLEAGLASLKSASQIA